MFYYIERSLFYAHIQSYLRDNYNNARNSSISQHVYRDPYYPFWKKRPYSLNSSINQMKHTASNEIFVSK